MRSKRSGSGKAGRRVWWRRSRPALKEQTHERVPLHWAATQYNLGNALWRLGERERGTGKLEEAVAAYREALKEHTRERARLGSSWRCCFILFRVPSDWAVLESIGGGSNSPPLSR
jgi:hypothetical protein